MTTIETYPVDIPYEHGEHAPTLQCPDCRQDKGLAPRDNYTTNQVYFCAVGHHEWQVTEPDLRYGFIAVCDGWAGALATVLWTTLMIASFIGVVVVAAIGVKQNHWADSPMLYAALGVAFATWFMLQLVFAGVWEVIAAGLRYVLHVERTDD